MHVREEGEFWEEFAQVAAIGAYTLFLGTPGEFGNAAPVFISSPMQNNRCVSEGEVALVMD
jgi:hypothetical protein